MKNKSIKKKRGAELIESMLVIVIVVSIAFVLFYPMISNTYSMIYNGIMQKFEYLISII